MGRLYKIVEEINRIISEKRLDPGITKGRISLKVGFLLSFPENAPDDKEMEKKLINVAREVLGKSIKLKVKNG